MLLSRLVQLANVLLNSTLHYATLQIYGLLYSLYGYQMVVLKIDILMQFRERTVPVPDFIFLR